MRRVDQPRDLPAQRRFHLAPVEAFSSIEAPALVMTGSRSPLSQQRTVERLVELLPHGTLRRFDGVGHMAPITHHALIDAAIVEHVCAS